MVFFISQLFDPLLLVLILFLQLLYLEQPLFEIELVISFLLGSNVVYSIKEFLKLLRLFFPVLFLGFLSILLFFLKFFVHVDSFALIVVVEHHDRLGSSCLGHYSFSFIANYLIKWDSADVLETKL